MCAKRWYFSIQFSRVFRLNCITKESITVWLPMHRYHKRWTHRNSIVQQRERIHTHIIVIPINHGFEKTIHFSFCLGNKFKCTSNTHHCKIVWGKKREKKKRIQSGNLISLSCYHKLSFVWLICIKPLLFCTLSLNLRLLFILIWYFEFNILCYGGVHNLKFDVRKR